MKAWLLFGAGLVAAVAGLGWMSATVLELDRRALVSEHSRLALWRMDLALSRLVSQESTRPATDYLPGSRAPREAPAAGGQVLLWFDVAPEGHVTSPQPGVDQQLLTLRPALQAMGRPASLGNARGASRNEVEFNRRNFFAMNNMASAEPDDVESGTAPAWYGDALVLARRVRLADGLHVQGAWLNWDGLQRQLLLEVKDLLPAARLEPVKGAQEGDGLMLASLPVRLVPGPPARVNDPERTPVWWAIVAAWVALGLVALALGALLAGALALDARRVAFVSAVTHELRTPLTTFKLYAEMLEEDMVPPEKRKSYLTTLRQEANRLGALVENVLAYSQVEKGWKRKPLEALPCSELLEATVPRLEARAGSRLVVGPIPGTVVKADRTSVEQILFNLVDNACKYAPDGRLELGFSERSGQLVIHVSDAGPGVHGDVERKLFQPLRKSAAESAESAQGIGLGLALSRSLARAMGGDLRYRASNGATFELVLRRVTKE
ncbi:MAG: HAMP domain-containing sensor histidine kinase [Myxococcales bacterium]|nr:HAMP domain-containing sensor histidine kinase [Myxococcales bacterium]